MQIEQFMCRSDNFGVILHEESSGKTAAIDAPDADTILTVLRKKNWTLDYLFITHHHSDHIVGIEKLKAATGALVIGPKAEQLQIGGLDKAISEGDNFSFGNSRVMPLSTPGHTSGALSYYLPLDQLLFTGDTLFSLGCGRLFEGSPSQMHASLQKLAQLPDETLIYCGHEYTQANGRFALSIDGGNHALQQRMIIVDTLRAQNLPTLPTTIGQEKATNPFLRCNNSEIRANLNLDGADDITVFTQIRRLKDNFK
ncbi:hydroxyacylglutathione hydrolase [Bartonella sp. HY329]|uniref:hydroxyacylglutathione hydrolase n=1 Tax=unclassified Bartonella TaxID=2645622 RepID=UPI0021C79BBC|nr:MULTISPECIES: hydroxyacylglutathione hydrolase [unclassified Bartonella]UXM95531.1 hydroxyacylglutathione hydrolase [Bartonella sp. HY329]UXN09856.1 hydroxyacylglutathione hydrolase [Bartonella sp. HY328]